MSDPVTFDSTSARFSLPLLFVGQAQKEDFVNEAIVMIDGLLHCAIEAELNTPPATPIDGQCWLVGSAATGAWTGHEGAIAMRQLGQWLFALPRDGMQVLNKATAQRIGRIAGTWRAPAAPTAASGGTVVDVEARSSLAALMTALKQAGVLPA
ncbi:DUF2793 domain-containing protein [Novosphingobium bradum]|uniref:DUF2793 domain-containing protein n=1 Tax=Novosphingobium bradum TaxID=1737444 RepID=A0ABV7ITF5_9SPHN